jgi:hypothetical protein
MCFIFAAECRYEAMSWGECDLRTNTMTRDLKLKAGDPALCQQTKQLTKKCKKRKLYKTLFLNKYLDTLLIEMLHCIFIFTGSLSRI